MDALPEFDGVLAGRYALGREIGRGGMAAVYLADDVKHGRRVAVKVLSRELAAAVGAERFLREIAVTATLHHPHILALLDSGEADGRLFYVMLRISAEGDPPFRLKPITRFGRSRSRISPQADHPFR